MGVYGSFEHMTKEQLSEAGKKGGKASVEARRRRKELKETLEILLNMSLDKRRKNVDIEKIQAFADLKGKNVTVDEAMMIKLVQKALSGDLNSISMVRDTIGEKPTEKTQTELTLTQALVEFVDGKSDDKDSGEVPPAVN